MTITIEQVGNSKLQFGEGLSWDDQLNRLYFVDVFGPHLFWMEYENGKIEVLELPSKPSVALLTDNPRIVIVSLEEALYLVDTADGSFTFMAELPGRMNDAVIDSEGRLITGSQFFGPDFHKLNGEYWSYTSQTSWTQIDSGKGNTNGPCFSPDGLTFYIADTPAKRIYQYDYDHGTGRLSNCQIFASVEALGGWPDGAKVDSEGGVWSVLIEAGKLVRFTPDGKVNRIVELPTDHATDVIFAGSHRDIAYLTTVGMGHSEGDDEWAGSLISIKNLGIQGLPEYRFKNVAQLLK